MKKVYLLFSHKQDFEYNILTWSLRKLLNYTGWNEICVVPMTIMPDLQKLENQRMKEN